MRLKISKSRYTAGLQCEKRLWLEVHRRDLMDEVDSSTQAIFDQGHEIGVLAQSLYPGGVLIEEDHLHMDDAIRATEKAVKNGTKVIYEAGAEHAGARARADIMVRNADGAWDMIEVKGSSQVKDTYLDDLAIQRFIFEGAGYRMRKSSLCHLDTRYVRKGELEVARLFKVEDVTPAVKKRMSAIPDRLKGFFEVLGKKKEPSQEIGGCCSDPYDCPFIGYCWKDVPEGSVFELYMGRGKPEELYKTGVVLLKDIPEDVKLTGYQKLQVEAVRTGKPHWNVRGISEFLNKIKYPLAFLDFEAFNPAIPPYDDTRPFQKIPFQYSVHLQSKPGGPLEHLEYLAEGDVDPRPELTRRLIEDLGKKGTVLSYSSYESAVINQLAREFPRQQKSLEAISERILDLGIPFRAGHVVYGEFGGSWSIKKVLPVLVPGMGYDSLEVGQGMEAVDAFNRLRSPDNPAKEKAKIRKDLLTYCAQDTMAMVKLLEVLIERSAFK